MKNNTILAPLWLNLPVFAPADEGAGGGGDAGGDAGADAQKNTGDDAGAAGGDAGDKNADDQGGQKAILDGGGTAKGDDNSDGGKDDGEDGGDEGEDAEVPDEYDFSAGLPEGMEIDAAMAEAVAPVFKDLGLTQAQAAKLTEAYGKVVEAQTKANADAITSLMDDWVKAAKEDKEIGLKEWVSTVKTANAVLRQFGTKELIDNVMVAQGVGNHPEMIRMLTRIGKAMGDDTLVTGDETDTSSDVPTEEAWYGSTTPKMKKG